MPYKGGKRKKKRTHKVLPPGAAVDKNPKCLVLRRGTVAKPVVELVQDLRKVMMPFTAPRLKERRSNSLRDFVDIAGPLGVTHLMMLSQTAKNSHLRLGRLPHGPTLTFRLETYAISRAIRGAQKHPPDISMVFEQPPLVVLHGFNTTGSGAAVAKAAGTAGVSLSDALKMTTTVLQNTFPQIQPATVKVSSCKRVVIFHYDADSGLIEFRHFAIRTVAGGMSKAVRKVAASQSSSKHLPDLGQLDDVAEFVLSGGRTGAVSSAAEAASDSEGEPDESSRVGAQQAAIKLSEIGPRMTLRLVKIEQDLTKGEVLYHAFESKTVAELQEQRKSVAEKQRLKEERKAVQEANVKRKDEEKAAKKAAKEARLAAKLEAAKKAAAEGRLADDEEEEAEEGGEDADDADEGDEAEVAEDDGDEDDEEDADDDDDEQEDEDAEVFEDEEEEEDGDDDDDDEEENGEDDDDEDEADDDEEEEEEEVEPPKPAPKSAPVGSKRKADVPLAPPPQAKGKAAPPHHGAGGSKKPRRA